MIIFNRDACEGWLKLIYPQALTSREVKALFIDIGLKEAMRMARGISLEPYLAYILTKARILPNRPVLAVIPDAFGNPITNIELAVRFNQLLYKWSGRLLSNISFILVAHGALLNEVFLNQYITLYHAYHAPVIFGIPMRVNDLAEPVKCGRRPRQCITLAREFINTVGKRVPNAKYHFLGINRKAFLAFAGMRNATADTDNYRLARTSRQRDYRGGYMIPRADRNLACEWFREWIGTGGSMEITGFMR